MNNRKIRKKKISINIGILGASGYTGSELIRLLSHHPYVRIKFLTGDRSKGKRIGEIFSHLSHKNFPIIKDLNEITFNKVDLIFSCMPNGKLASIISNFPKTIKIIDLSADFRFNEKEIYENYYEKHPAQMYLKKFTYGLTEVNRKKIKNSKFIACPGCYPTSILLAIIPLLNSNFLNEKEIIVDSKSGISGAGRSLKENLLFSENFASISAYGNGDHRHRPEIEHNIHLATKKKLSICFTPHLIPISRGILSSIYIKAKSKNVQKVLEKYYEKEKFLLINPINMSPKISDVIGSNSCKIGIIDNKNSDYITIISVIDNLIKGASGQAIQNMNLMFDLPEELGLDNQSIWP